MIYFSAKKLYPTSLESLGGNEIEVMRRKDEVKEDDMLLEVPEELRVYNEPKPEEPADSPVHGAASNSGRFHITKFHEIQI